MGDSLDGSRELSVEAGWGRCGWCRLVQESRQLVWINASDRGYLSSTGSRPPSEKSGYAQAALKKLGFSVSVG